LRLIRGSGSAWKYFRGDSIGYNLRDTALGLNLNT
jgi:hypothetical protein